MTSSCFCLVEPRMNKRQLVFRPSRTADCGPSDSPIEFRLSSLSPDPIRNPGSVHVSAEINLREAMSLEGVRIKLRLQKLEPRQMTVPCFRRFGSCSYDVCQMITNYPSLLCPTFPQGERCGCRAQPGRYLADLIPVALPNFGSIIGKIMQGNYNGNATLLNARGKTLGCLEFDFAIKNSS